MTKKIIIICEVCAHLFKETCYTMFVNPNTLYSFCYTPISNKNTFSEKGQSHNCPFLRCKKDGYKRLMDMQLNNIESYDLPEAQET